MNLKSMHHIAIIVSNYEASKNFYVNLLGFEIIRENYRQERNSYKLDLKLGDSEIELFSMNNPPARPTHPEACGLRHIAFKVDNIDDVISELNEKGILTEPVRIDDYTGKKLTFFSDPDGLPLELHE
ncbi:VOC family protein [Clostridium saccharobutylicum]|uniref:Metallothiol transferase FosB n=1 Tax=Clostridium saccharobutylicum TaxID=169679 RepID=A0A1S8N2D6_CLOSA|nr:VOC family protein [Clostridium saccharobutylicum]OOM10624.1 metallothiol transferase FosB [Clostridium saccharobutylicum]